MPTIRGVTADHCAVCPPKPFGSIGCLHKFEGHRAGGNIGPEFGVADISRGRIGDQAGKPFEESHFYFRRMGRPTEKHLWD
jgi:hypothetical protein